MNKDFENMGIYDLRNYARIVGVKAPTTLKRDELIEKINQILEGNAPKYEITKKGRPPRHKANDEFMLDIMLPSNLFVPLNLDYKYKTISSSSTEKIQQGVFCESSNVQDNDNLVFSGYLDNYSLEYGIVYFKGFLSEHARENIFIEKTLIDKYCLKRGDHLVGKAKYIPSKNLYIATVIDTINNKLFSNNISRKNFEEIHASYPTEIIELYKENYINFEIINKVCPIAKGSRVAVNSKKENQKNTFVLDLLKNFQSNGIRSTIISIGDSPEDIYNLIKNLNNIEVIEQLPSQKREEFLNKVDLAIQNNCNRLEYSQNVAIVFYNVNNLLNAMAQSYILEQGLSEIQAKIVAENKFLDIFNLAKTTENGSLTIVCFDTNENISNVANCMWVFKQIPYKNTDITLDLKKSYTKNYDKIFREEYIKKLNDFYMVKDEDDIEKHLQKLFE